jgi:hypothetical protein
MSDYQELMMREQASARRNYTYDPRVQLIQNFQRSTRMVEPFNGTPSTAQQQQSTEGYGLSADGPRGDERVVQAAPKSKPVKRYVIVDASQRDWIKQPNPYANLVFTFGSQSVIAQPQPVYTNNWFVPTFAVEQSNLPAPIPGIPNTGGWTLAATPSNIRYPAYNSSLPLGNFIATDNGFILQPSGSGFGSVFNASRVSSMRLIRAVLPQRQFLNIPIDTNPASADASLSAAIVSNLVGKPYSTFTTYPYLMFYLNEYFGQYVGGNEPMRRSFSVMTQKQRQQADFNNTVGVQQFDYEPWGEEALRFQSPLTSLQRIAVSVTDPIGSPFVQNDNLTISIIQATSNQMYLKCFTGSYQYFSSNEIRVGDRVSFYSESLSNILKSTLINYYAGKKSFVTALQGNTFPVLSLLDYVPDENGIYVPRDASDSRTAPYVSSYNGFIIPNFVTIGPDGTASPTYPSSIDSGTGTVLEIQTFISSNLPFLNVSLQPVYTLEMECDEPDTSTINATFV